MPKVQHSVPKEEPRAEGIIRKLLSDKGFGFIADAGGTEYFFHRSAMRSHHWDEVTEGQKVSFAVRQSPKGPRAEDVDIESV